METKPSFDLFLINKFQKISDWSQNWFGRDNFDIARYLWVIMIICFVLHSFFLFLEGFDVFGFFIILNLAVSGFYMRYLIRKIEQSVKNNPVFANCSIIEHAPLRLILRWFVFLILPATVLHFKGVLHPTGIKHELYHHWEELFFDFFYILAFMIIYFISCAPKPHKPSKVRKLIQRTREIVSGLTSPVLKPAFVKN